MSFLTSMRPVLRTTTSTISPLTVRRSLSKFTIVGRLAATPELVTTSSGRELVRYAVGTNSGYGENKSTSWWKVAAFAPEGAGRDYLLGLGKGSMLYVEGEASMRKYERDGKQEMGLSLVQSRYDVLDKRDPSPQAEVTEEE